MERRPRRRSANGALLRHRGALSADPGTDRVLFNASAAGERLGRLLHRVVPTTLLHNRWLLEAALLSLEVAVAASTGAAILGTLASIALVLLSVSLEGCS